MNENNGAMRGRKFAAFTLIELLVVVAIIAVLVAILAAALTRAREGARRAVCMSDLHQIGIGLVVYEDENNGWPPFFYSWMAKQVGDPRVFVCPADPGHGMESTAYPYCESRLDNSIPCSYWNFLSYIVVIKYNYWVAPPPGSWSWQEATYQAAAMRGSKQWEWSPSDGTWGNGFTHTRCFRHEPGALHISYSGRVYTYIPSNGDLWNWPEWYYGYSSL